VAILTSQVLVFQPDLVLTCISVADDVTGRLPTPSQFDWQRLHVVQFARRAFSSLPGGEIHEGPFPCASSVAPALSPEGRGTDVLASISVPLVDQEELLRATAGQLAVCRCPLDGRMRRRWHETLSHLEEIAAVCRRHQIATAFIVAPSAAQLDARLRSTLCRRAGYRTDEVDVRLPQRQLDSFAQQRDLLLIDLLPHFGRTEQATFTSAGCQWNDLGNRLAAEALGTWLRRRCGTLVAQK
jgi:hypothetical protein